MAKIIWARFSSNEIYIFYLNGNVFEILKWGIAIMVYPMLLDQCQSAMRVVELIDRELATARPTSFYKREKFLCVCPMYVQLRTIPEYETSDR